MQSRVRAKLQTHVSVQYSFLFCRNWLKSLNFRFVLNVRLLVNKDGSHINKSDIPLLSAFLDLIKQFHGKTGVI